MTGTMEHGEESGRVLVIFAHPDDAEFTSGGTIARWTAEGREVVYGMCTDGSRGTDSARSDPAAVAGTRREEQLSAARALGVRDVLFLDYADGELEAARDALRKDLVRLIREQRPGVVVTWDPWRPYQLHRDHSAAGYAAFYAAVEASVPGALDWGCVREPAPHAVDDVYLFGTDNADTWVDITDFVERKREAIRCHESQRSFDHIVRSAGRG